VFDGELVSCGAVREMEVVWPSGASLRGAASNRRALRSLSAVVVSGHGKVTNDRGRCGPGR
jgi:hypothetical protein